MNKKSNSNAQNKISGSSENLKLVEDKIKQTSSATSLNKEKKTIEEQLKNEQSVKLRKENTKNKTANSETLEKLSSNEQEKPNNYLDNKDKDKNEKLVAKLHYKNNKPQSMTKEEIKTFDENKDKTISNKKVNKYVSEKRLKENQLKLNQQFDINKAKEFCNDFEGYIENSGLSTAFKIIFAEILHKHVHKDNLFQYTAMRLRQIGKELEDLKFSQP